MRSLSVPQELAPPEREAILAHLHSLKDAREEAMRSFDLSLPGRPPLFVKRSNDIRFEASTQHFFYLRSIADGSAPRVPKVFDVCSSAEGAFMVMERIDAPTLRDCGISEDACVESAASAVEWLLSQSALVPDAPFGRISSKAAPVWHPSFKDESIAHRGSSPTAPSSLNTS